MNRVLAAGPITNELGINQRTLALIAVSLLAIYAVSMIWSTIKRPRSEGIIATLGMLLFMWLGFKLRDWPSREPGDGLIMSLLMAWRDAVLTALWALFKLLGASDAWDKLFAQFFN